MKRFIAFAIQRLNLLDSPFKGISNTKQRSLLRRVVLSKCSSQRRLSEVEWLLSG